MKVRCKECNLIMRGLDIEFKKYWKSRRVCHRCYERLKMLAFTDRCAKKIGKSNKVGRPKITKKQPIPKVRKLTWLDKLISR